MENKICIALDIPDLDQIKKIATQLHVKVGWFKINSAFTRNGPPLVKYLKSLGTKLFMDLKFHDIPNTVANYATEMTEMGVDMFNVHASGGFEMMQAARIAADTTAERLKISRPKIIAVTVLTSMDMENLNSVSVLKTPEEQVLTLARLAKQAGLDGVVASAKEAKLLRGEFGPDFLIVTPGIRLTNQLNSKQGLNDQKRIVTPKIAVESGANILVIGRPITEAENKELAIAKIIDEFPK